MKTFPLIQITAEFLLASTFIFLGPFSVYADNSSVATTTDTSTVSTATTSTTTSPVIVSNTESTSTTETSPTLNFAFSIPVSDPTGDNPIPVTATFSEPVTGFQLSSLNIGAGHAADFVQTSPTQYTFNVVVTVPNGTVSIDSNDGNVKDSGGNVAIAAPQLHVRFDSTLPNLTGSSTATSTGSSTGTTTSPTNGSGGMSTSTSPTGTGTGGTSTTTATTSPWILFTGGPANGSTISTSTATFTFETDASSTVSCSFGASPAVYNCGSPQTFSSLVDGVYPFTVFADYMNDIASTTSTFTVDLEDASSTTATSTGSDGSSTASSTSSSTASSTDTTSSGTYFGSDDGTSGGTSGGIIDNSDSSSGESSGSVITVTATPTDDQIASADTGTVYPDASGDALADSDTNYASDDITSSTTSTSTTSGSVLATADPSTTQTSAAVNSNVGKYVIWGSLIVLILILIGWSYRYLGRNTTAY